MNKANDKDSKGVVQNNISSDKIVELEIQLHIAEYNALTTRCTYFTNIQNIVVSVLVIWITAMIGIWISKPSYFVFWGSILGAQAFGIISAVLLYEEYNIIRYLESKLKPIIETLTNKRSFWGYQPFLITQRKNTYKIWEFSSVIVTGIVILGITIMRIPSWILGDYFGITLNLIVLYIFFSKTDDASEIRRNSWK